jgi:uncharacterized membrane protein
MGTSKYFSEEQTSLIVNAICSAEKSTSGEIRVHVDKRCKGDALDRAVRIFKVLRMDKTAARNGVLIYVALDSHKLAIIGDAGINAVVPNDFWTDARNVMIEHFQRANYAEGIARAVVKVGEQLKAHFPYHEDDVDELSNEVSFGNL